MSWSTDDVDRHSWLSIVSVVGLCGGVLLVAIGGTPFDMPMPTHAVGWVTPTCGLTRGSTALLRGDIGLAWRYNPVSLLVVSLGVIGLVRLTYGRSTSRWLNVKFRVTAPVMGLLVVAFGLLWWVQQSNAAFIISARR